MFLTSSSFIVCHGNLVPDSGGIPRRFPFSLGCNSLFTACYFAQTTSSSTSLPLRFPNGSWADRSHVCSPSKFRNILDPSRWQIVYNPRPLLCGHVLLEVLYFVLCWKNTEDIWHFKKQLAGPSHEHLYRLDRMLEWCIKYCLILPSVSVCVCVSTPAYLVIWQLCFL